MLAIQAIRSQPHAEQNDVRRPAHAVTPHNNPAARNFFSMLPISLEIEDFSSNNKIAYPPRKADRQFHLRVGSKAYRGCSR